MIRDDRRRIFEAASSGSFGKRFRRPLNYRYVPTVCRDRNKERGITSRRELRGEPGSYVNSHYRGSHCAKLPGRKSAKAVSTVEIWNPQRGRVISVSRGIEYTTSREYPSVNRSSAMENVILFVTFLR